MAVNQRRKRATGIIHLALQCIDCGKYHTIPESKFNSNKKLAVV